MGTIHRKRDGAGGFFMRFFEVPSGKASANEHHEEQHQVYIVSGRGEVLIGDAWHPFGPSDVVFVPGGEQHCFRNTGRDILRFICVAERAW